MPLLYACISRDASLTLCDYPTNSEYPKRTSKFLSSFLPTDTNFMHTYGDTKVHIKRKNVIYIVCTSFDTPDEKSERIINSLISYFELFYKGRTEALLQQTNLSPHILDAPFKQSFERLFNDYNTGISSSLVAQAQIKADQTKTKILVNVDQMLITNEDTKELEDQSEEMKNMSEAFLDNSKGLNKVMKDRNWWLCSKCCVILFAVIIVCVAGLVLGLVFGLRKKK